MAFKSIVGFCWFVGILSYLSFFFISLFFSSGVIGGSILSPYLVFDFVGFMLSLISFLLFYSLLSWWGIMGVRCRIFVFFSVSMSLLSYISSNVVLFWFSYEMSILPLLYLLVVESPYSERFIASWYLGGYIVLTSVPLFISIVYLAGFGGTLHLGFIQNLHNWGSIVSIFVLCMCFITKIPLVPFHSWLPIVHAESSSSVSVCLSGFIMKLGVLGVFRFGSSILPYYIFSHWYILFIFGVSLFMFLFCCQELDGKRWLAFLSLAHIVICVLGLNFADFDTFQTPFVFCLGHGFSAGLTFMYLWFFYMICGSRNWNVLKFGSNAGLFFRFLMVLVLCTVASFPPTISFFSEVRLFMGGGVVSFFLSVLFYFYLFLGGLIPLFIVGGCLTSHNSVSCYSGFSLSSVFSLVFLCLFCCVFFLLL